MIEENSQVREEGKEVKVLGKQGRGSPLPQFSAWGKLLPWRDPYDPSTFQDGFRWLMVRKALLLGDDERAWGHRTWLKKKYCNASWPSIGMKGTRYRNGEAEEPWHPHPRSSLLKVTAENGTTGLWLRNLGSLGAEFHTEGLRKGYFGRPSTFTDWL